MTDDESVDSAFYELAARHLAGDLDDVEEARLLARLAGSVACQRALVDISLHARLISAAPLGVSALDISRVSRAVARDQVFVTLARAASRVNRPLVWSVLACSVLFVGYFAVISWNLRGAGRPRGGQSDSSAVASISDTNEEVGFSRSPEDGNDVRAGEPFQLESGIVQMRLKQGVTLVIEGPAEWTVDGANNATLARGKLTAEVPSQASGFILDTPTAHIIDLGTEFDVEVDASRHSRVRVTKGVIQVSERGAGSSPRPLTMVAGDAAEISPGRVLKLPASSTVAQTQKRASAAQAVEMTTLDMADIVAGGDGLGKRRDRGIDIVTGLVVRATDEDIKSLGYRTGVFHFVATRFTPFIDGVFMPNQVGQATLDSAGHKYNQFGVSDGTTFGPVWAGGEIPLPPNFSTLPNFRVPTSIKGVDYANRDRGLLWMHSNKGITFNVAELRKHHKLSGAAQFKAIASNQIVDRTAHADVRVFVDGNLRFEKMKIVHGVPQPIDLALPADARFLTLVVSQGSDGSMSDWIIFGQPTIAFERKGKL